MFECGNYIPTLMKMIRYKVETLKYCTFSAEGPRLISTL